MNGIGSARIALDAYMLLPTAQYAWGWGSTPEVAGDSDLTSPRRPRQTHCHQDPRAVGGSIATDDEGNANIEERLTIVACEMRLLAMKASSVRLLFLRSVASPGRLVGVRLRAVTSGVGGALALALLLFGFV